MSNQYLKTREVAQMLGVSLNTIYRWLKSEKINEPNRDGNNNYRLWRVEDIDQIRRKLLEQGRL